jgi:hypothetical protein
MNHKNKTAALNRHLKVNIESRNDHRINVHLGRLARSRYVISSYREALAHALQCASLMRQARVKMN